MPCPYTPGLGWRAFVGHQGGHKARPYTRA
jgi:hypothetical protein